MFVQLLANLSFYAQYFNRQSVDGINTLTDIDGILLNFDRYWCYRVKTLTDIDDIDIVLKF